MPREQIDVQSWGTTVSPPYPQAKGQEKVDQERSSKPECKHTSKNLNTKLS